MASVLLNNNYASHSNDKATIILRTEKYTIPKKFKFSTDTCLIYAETIELTSDITAQGKSIGLFCHRLKLSSHVTIDVPGDKGAAGDNHVDKDRRRRRCWKCLNLRPVPSKRKCFP
ncbi:hypothetical protein AWENTII_007343 [Aspergillus wentii]